MFQFSLILPLVKEKLFCGTELHFVDDRKTHGDVAADSHWITNFSVFSGKLIPHLELFAEVQNLFNQRHTHVAYENMDPLHRIPQDKRSVRVGFTMRF